MTTYLLRTALLLIAIASHFSTTAQTNTFPATGDVGIGTLTPLHKLDVIGDVNLSTGNSLRVGGNTVFDVSGVSNVHIGVGSGVISAGSFNVFLGD